MPWNLGVFTPTNGTYTGANIWASDAAAGINISSSRHDIHDYDLAQGINACLTKDGSNTAAAVNTGTLTTTGTTSVKLGVQPASVVNNGANPTSIDWSAGFVQYASINAPKSLSFSNILAGVSYTLFVNNTDSSNHTLSVPSGCGGIAGITLNANTIYQIIFIKVGNLISLYSLVSYASGSFVGP